MSCQEAFFAEAHCRIEVEPRHDVGPTRYLAAVSIVDPETQAIRPLVDEEGGRLGFAAESEPLAFSTALAYLEQRFGAFSEIAYGCREPEPRAEGPTPTDEHKA